VSRGAPGGRDPGLTGPGPVVDSSVVDGNAAAVSVTIITTRAAGDRLQRARRVSQIRIQLAPPPVPPAPTPPAAPPPPPHDGDLWEAA
jgi:hypothetical protein